MKKRRALAHEWKGRFPIRDEGKLGCCRPSGFRRGLPDRSWYVLPPQSLPNREPLSSGFGSLDQCSTGTVQLELECL